MNNLKAVKILAFSLLACALHMQAIAHEVGRDILNGQTSEAKVLAGFGEVKAGEAVEPKFTELPDKFNLIKDSLVSAADSHYYGFTALRGQKVLIQGHLSGSAQLEIHDGAKWNMLASGQKIVLLL